MSKVKKRNPQDSTMRNVRAVNRRLDRLELQMATLITLLAVGIDRDKFLNIKRKTK